MDSNTGEPSDPKFLHIPYDKRWEYLKPTITRLYMEEKVSLDRLAERMKTEYSFSAQKPQYRYHLKKWGLKKRITTAEKDSIVSTLGKRPRPGASTGDVTIWGGGFGKEVDKKQMKRYLGDQIRRRVDSGLDSKLFLRFNLPYEATIASLGLGLNHPTPPSSNPATPDNLVVNSPNEVGSPSQTNTGLSPTVQLVPKKILADRAKLLLQGSYDDLMENLGKGDRAVLTNWMHDFWMFSFMTAKYWGKGPERWTPSLIQARSLGDPQPLTSNQPSPSQRIGHSSIAVTRENSANELCPTDLCNWAIHYYERDVYERVPSPPLQQPQEQDIEVESTWQAWGGSSGPRGLVDTLGESLSSNAFSSIDQSDLSILASTVTETVKRSPEQLVAQSWGSAIMARNINLLESLAEDIEFPEAVQNTYPYHLAASYIDGAKSCCGVLEAVAEYLDFEGLVTMRSNFINDLGHTVLDCLFLNILRSHTSALPRWASTSFKGRTCFPGEEVDICGRWDADSPCVRQLHASGVAAIPSHWKHPFCHTSVQATCHAISVILPCLWDLFADKRSGLFKETCNACGCELPVYPLHSLVLVAFYLCDKGRAGETLFGALACLVCLLGHGADPLLRAEISVEKFQGFPGSSVPQCNHPSMTPAELASKVPADLVDSWDRDRRIGWRVFAAVLAFVEREKTSTLEKNNATDDSTSGEYRAEPLDMGLSPFDLALLYGENLYCLSPGLGALWAAVQTEFLTYRRIGEDDMWLSNNFDMDYLLQGLENGRGPTQIPLLEKGMMRTFSRCGRFPDARNPLFPIAREVCSTYFMNCDVWNRETFIGVAEPSEDWRLYFRSH